MIKAYTDGSCNNKTGVGGWGVVFIRNNDTTTKEGRAFGVKSNEMELLAVVNALGEYPNEKMTIYTDSAYVLNGIKKWRKKWAKNGWRSARGETIAHKYLWQKADRLIKARPKTQVVKVKAHSGNPWNNLADRLAKGQQ